MVKKILTNIREHRYIIKTNSKHIDAKKIGLAEPDKRLDTEPLNGEPNSQMLTFDSMCKQLPKDLDHVNEWAADQIMLLHTYINDRNKLVEANLKYNKLATENSRL